MFIDKKKTRTQRILNNYLFLLLNKTSVCPVWSPLRAHHVHLLEFRKTCQSNSSRALTTTITSVQFNISHEVRFDFMAASGLRIHFTSHLTPVQIQLLSTNLCHSLWGFPSCSGLSDRSDCVSLAACMLQFVVLFKGSGWANKSRVENYE